MRLSLQDGKNVALSLPQTSQANQRDRDGGVRALVSCGWWLGLVRKQCDQLFCWTVSLFTAKHGQVEVGRLLGRFPSFPI